MERFIQYVAGMTSGEVAYATALFIVLAVFLVPMYLVHCTGRNLLANVNSLIAHREWMFGPIVFVYQRWPRTKAWHGPRRVSYSSRKWDIGLGSIMISMTRLDRHRARAYRRVYKHAKRA